MLLQNKVTMMSENIGTKQKCRKIHVDIRLTLALRGHTSWADVYNPSGVLQSKLR